MRNLLFTIVAAASPSLAVAASFAPLPQTIAKGQPIPIVIDGALPGELVEITATRVLPAPGGGGFRSRATFKADARGGINVAKQAPVRADYEGIDAAGLFWSMKAEKALTLKPGQVELTAIVGGETITTGTTIIVKPDDITEEVFQGFPGARVFRPASPKGALPAIIILGGSEGGTISSFSVGPRLASLGYVVLGLPYYSPVWYGRELPELPGAFVNIPVDRLEAARDQLIARGDVRADRIALWGVSKGGEYAVIAASRMPWLRAVAAIVPSDVVWEGFGSKAEADTTSSFAYKGEPLPWMPYKDMKAVFAAAARGERGDFRQAHVMGRAAHPERLAAARIPIENYKGALLVAGGKRDHIWDSFGMSKNIADTRKAAGLPTTTLLFETVGHSLTADEWEPMFSNDPHERPADMVAASRKVWRATAEFFDKALK